MNQEVTSQEITLKNRNDLQITGVKKIESLNSNEFRLNTVLGKMVVRGTDLEMKHLDIEREILLITGKIHLIEYLSKDQAAKTKGFLAKLFK